MVRALAPALSFALILSTFAAFAQTPVPTQAEVAAADAQAAQDHEGALKQAETGKPPQRIRNIALVGNQPCPKATDPTEVVVCSRIEEPYRIPKGLRDKKPIPAQNQSWVNRAAALDEVGRKAGNLPNSCTNIGASGSTGCSLAQIKQWAAEKRARENGESIDPNNP
jgi:hypothetical protein